MKAVVIVQARMGSSRLPGKTLAPLGDLTVLDWVIQRCSNAADIDEVVVATTDLQSDDPIADHLASTGVTCVRGSSDDVLSRYLKAATHSAADIVVRVTADCPLVDPGLIDDAVALLREDDGIDYVSTSLHGGYPRGLDVEALTAATLRRVASDAVDPEEREHVTLHVYRHPDVYRCKPVPGRPIHHHPEYRFTVDEPEDLLVVRSIVTSIGKSPVELITSDIVEYLERNPEVAQSNGAVQHRNII